jgi:hypothetical protein
VGIKLLWTGVTVWVALPLVMHTAQAPLAGAVLMAVGCVLMWLDK